MTCPEGGGQPTPVIDRFYFSSIYFREPSGVLFEIATIGPGFTADEPFETLGESLSLPPNFEQSATQVEQILAPLPNPRRARPVIVRERPAVGEAEGALVLFHGRGADEDDLFPLLDVLDPERKRPAYCPRGPLVLPPGGRTGTRSTGRPSGSGDVRAVVRRSRCDGSTRCPTRADLAGRLLAGRGHGYALGTRRRPAAARDAIVATSGFIPQTEAWEADLSPPLPPIAIAHGIYDPVISVEFAAERARVLEEAGQRIRCIAISDDAHDRPELSC